MSDAEARALAVDVTQSVVVQAPAGSGKTTLLVERYIALLQHVESPEEILAITFTRKAAAEMRRRILTYLAPDFCDWGSHEAGIREKVEKIRHRIKDWALIENPQRLEIRTIDSFCHSLARTMPIAGQLGPVPSPVDQPQKLYRSAARATLQENAEAPELISARTNLLAWCDHDHYRVESLITQLLAKREQWLRIINSGGHFDRAQQDRFLSLVVNGRIEAVQRQLHEALQAKGVNISQILACSAKAIECLREEHATHPLFTLENITDYPVTHVADLAQWVGLSELMTTNQGSFRKALTKALGFPPKSDHKEAMLEILDNLMEFESLAQDLSAIRDLPDPHYSDEEWAILEDLITVLRHAALNLQLLFAKTGQSDFTAMSAAAIQGLGDEDTGYTDIALYLDRKIQHILVDEYQDTNWTQFELLKRLIQGWDEQAQRTLFVVGDPMQSIYRFREAEVGLFVRTRDFGIDGHQLTHARLTKNFRSCPTIVNWVNDYLGPLFPSHEDIASGAIAYSPSEASLETSGEVTLQTFETKQQEAIAVVDFVQANLDAHSDDENYSMAIIVRARSHLNEIIPKLQERHIAFRAVKLDRLIDRPVVQDLIALTKVILNAQDRTALIALLHSPMIGLTLADLAILLPDKDHPIGSACLQNLTGEAQQRAKRLFDVIDHIDLLYGRYALFELVEGAWNRLGGPDCGLDDQFERRSSDSASYFDALAHAEANGLVDDWNDFIEWIESTHTEGGPNQKEVKLDILTMHGAKGLEWDSVILPGLQASPNRSDSDLLYWLPFPLEEDDQGVLIAPLSASSDSDKAPRIALIKKERAVREQYESLRLMYVAATRAKASLFLSASLKRKDDGIKPPSGSLLETVWPTLGPCFEKHFTPLENEPTTDISDDGNSTDEIIAPTIDQSFYRVTADFRPQWSTALQWRCALPKYQRESEIEFNWAGAQARRNGTVLHHLLEMVGRVGIEATSSSSISHLRDRIPALLLAQGSDPRQLDELSKVLDATFQAVLTSETGRWILSNQHVDSQCEYALTGRLDGQLVNAIVDRTFKDEKGQRWIIDYKSGYHAGGDLAGFLDQEAERYKSQLSMYADLFRQMGDEAIVKALYLPRHDALKIID